MKKILFILTLGIIALVRCTDPDDGSVRIPDKPFDLLSEYRFFTGEIRQMTPNKRVLPYDLKTPLFSDYSHKARFVWMPEGTAAAYTTDHVLDFPVGTALIKNFFYENDERDPSAGRRIIETRILIHRGEEWDAYGYIWNDEGTDAAYDVIGDVQKIAWTDRDGTRRSVDYIVPNKNQCKSCHSYDNKQIPIGPKVRNLNKEYAYDSGTQNQLRKWAEVGYLSGFSPEMPHPSVADWEDAEHYRLQDRALAYLDINCGHCHNPSGAANTSGLTLLSDSPIDATVGVYKPTVSAGAGTGGHTYNIVPGKPDESIMIYRMRSDNPGAMMPEVGRRLVHEEGVRLVAEWIAQMDQDVLRPDQAKSLN